MRASRFFVALGLGLTCLALAAAGCGRSSPPAAAGPDDEIVAVVAGEPIRLGELERALAGDLVEVDRERQEILERGLELLVSQRLLELEAAAQGLSPGALLAEQVEAALEPPTDAEIDAFYEENKERIRRPLEEVAARIRQLLIQQRREQGRSAYLATLAERHGVETRLEPLRLPVAADGFPAQGPAAAPVTLVEFSDFECPYCSQLVPTLERIREAYGDRVRLVFRQFPLERIHPHARKAAEAALCAHQQERFWEMHDAMFADPERLAVDELKQTAADLGLDAAAFADCLDSGRLGAAVEADLEEGRRLGVKGTPALFVNGRFVSGNRSYDDLAAMIDDELAG